MTQVFESIGIIYHIRLIACVLIIGRNYSLQIHIKVGRIYVVSETKKVKSK